MDGDIIANEYVEVTANIWIALSKLNVDEAFTNIFALAPEHGFIIEKNGNTPCRNDQQLPQDADYFVQRQKESRHSHPFEKKCGIVYKSEKRGFSPLYARG